MTNKKIAEILEYPKTPHDCGPYHDWQEFIDPSSGGFICCKICGTERDCEDPDGDLQ